MWGNFPQILGNNEFLPAVLLGFVVAIGICMTAGFLLGRAEDQKK